MITDRHVGVHAVDKDVEQQHSVCRGFAEELVRFRLQAGRPTHKELEDISKKQPDLRMLHRSTVNDILQGKYSRIPDWEWVYSFITVCRTYAERSHACTDQLADVAEWYRRWYIATRSSLNTAPWPITSADHTNLPASAGGDEPARRATMLAMAQHAPALGWWHEFEDVVPDCFAIYLSLEPAADLLRTYETRWIPDLLQTADYTRSILRLAHPDAAAADIDHRIDLRMRRQQILHRPEPATLWAIIDEQALHHTNIPAATMHAQVKHLIQIGAQPNIAIQVMPNGRSTAPGPITILRFPQSELPDVVYLEQLTVGLYPDSPDDIHHYRQVLDRLGIEATKGDATTAIFHQLLTDT